MSKRLLGVLVMVLLTFAVAAPVAAVEEGEELEVEHEELPSYDEIGSGTETAKEFRPEPYEEPTVFGPMLYPLLIIAFVAVTVVLGLYLWWQPNFSQEREAKKQG